MRLGASAWQFDAAALAVGRARRATTATARGSLARLVASQPDIRVRCVGWGVCGPRAILRWPGAVPSQPPSTPARRGPLPHSPCPSPHADGRFLLRGVASRLRPRVLGREAASFDTVLVELRSCGGAPTVPTGTRSNPPANPRRTHPHDRLRHGANNAPAPFGAARPGLCWLATSGHGG